MTNQLECEYLSLEGYGILCAAFEFDIEEWLDIQEEYKVIDDYTIIERTTTCIHCGQTDIDYPV
jgi:hypothetical protein